MLLYDDILYYIRRQRRAVAARLRQRRGGLVLGATNYAPEITKVKFHWKMPLKFHWEIPGKSTGNLKILWKIPLTNKIMLENTNENQLKISTEEIHNDF